MGRYDLTEFEWSVIEPLIPMDRRGPKPQNNRQIINGMFYILRTGSPLPTCPSRRTHPIRRSSHSAPAISTR
ncbi:MAG: transposase [Hyphomicrobiaceae bacterium]